MLFGCTNNSNYSKEIIESIHSNDYDKFEKLLSKSKNLNVKPYSYDLDRVNMPPLHFACKEGKLDFVIKLVEAGADVNNCNHSLASSPLLVTLESNTENRFKIAKYLIEKGANINIKANNFSVFDYVFTYNSNNYNETKELEEFEFALYLLERGASITDVRLGHVIFNAAKFNNKLMINYLYNTLNVNLDLQDISYGNTPLIWAVKFNCFNVVKYLLDNNVDQNIINNEGKTAKQIALETNNLEIYNLFK